MSCLLVVQSLAPLFGLYFLHSCLSWGVLSVPSNEHIPEPFYHYRGYISSPSWVATLPRYDELVVEQLHCLRWAVRAWDSQGLLSLPCPQFLEG